MTSKTMTRSRNQIATSYAPESFFAFEGGIGVCIAKSTAGIELSLSANTKDQIFKRLEEFGSNWLSLSRNARSEQPDKPTILATQCVDQALLDFEHVNFRLPSEDKFYLCKPSRMEYTPAPLAFRCQTCKLFLGFDSLEELYGELPNLNSAHCQHPKKVGGCNWRQLDVIFVHWSGNWAAPMAAQFQWDDVAKKVVRREEQCSCGSSRFTLHTESPAIGDWYFSCAVCEKRVSAKWLQNDKRTLELIGARANQASALTEVRMQVTPYRASNSYYVQSDQFIDFKETSTDFLSRLAENRHEQLKDFIAQEYGFKVVAPTDAEVEAACSSRPDVTKIWLQFKAAVDGLAALATLPPSARVSMEAALTSMEQQKAGLLESLRDRGVLVAKAELPNSVLLRLISRRERFAPKYDPFRLAIEHATLRVTRLEKEEKIGGKAAYVPFTRLDEDLRPEGQEATKKAEARTKVQLDALGVEEMGLIREFELCKFSFGYSRMEPGPVLADKRDMAMPVKLNLFPSIPRDDGQKHPIYVVQQANEAIYVRLSQDYLRRWLESLGCVDMFASNGDEKIGAGLLGTAVEMKSYLDHIPKSEEPNVYLYAYTLLHSFSHLLMKAIAEYSGLDLGSLGEYLFPADLAFVVYRNGTTMDLGNLSAMWRNSGNIMLESMLKAKAVQCATGSLCTTRGGACPDCLMVPETSCIAGNKLLSRSVLRNTGGRPKFDDRKKFVTPGYFNSLAPEDK